MEAVFKYLTIERLCVIIRIWKRNKISDASCTKLQRLWMGFDFVSYMDDKGRIAIRYLNDIRRALGYPDMKRLKEDIMRSEAFYLLGNNQGEVTHIASPIWHMYDKKQEGISLPGSLRFYENNSSMPTGTTSKGGNNPFHFGQDSDLNSGQDFGQDFDAYCKVNLCKVNNPTGGDPGGLALSEPGEDGIVFGEDVAGFEKEQTRHTDTNAGTLHSKEKILRNLSEGRRVAREYLAWVRQQTDTNHQDWVNECLLRITQSRDMEGQKTELTDEQGNEVLNILLQEVLPYELAKRDTFFKGAFMKNPASRIYWLRNLTRHYGKGFFVQARQRWNRRKDRLQSLRLKEQREQLRQNRPISPHEWQDAEGRRWYLQRGCRASIPASAPPRPTEQHEWVPYCNEWRTKEPVPVTTQSNN